MFWFHSRVVVLHIRLLHRPFRGRKWVCDSIQIYRHVWCSFARSWAIEASEALLWRGPAQIYRHPCNLFAPKSIFCGLRRHNLDQISDSTSFHLLKKPWNWSFSIQNSLHDAWTSTNTFKLATGVRKSWLACSSSRIYFQRNPLFATQGGFHVVDQRTIHFRMFGAVRLKKNLGLCQTVQNACSKCLSLFLAHFSMHSVWWRLLYRSSIAFCSMFCLFHSSTVITASLFQSSFPTSAKLANIFEPSCSFGFLCFRWWPLLWVRPSTRGQPSTCPGASLFCPWLICRFCWASDVQCYCSFCVVSRSKVMMVFSKQSFDWPKQTLFTRSFTVMNETNAELEYLLYLRKA